MRIYRAERPVRGAVKQPATGLLTLLSGPLRFDHVPWSLCRVAPVTATAPRPGFPRRARPGRLAGAADV